MATTRPSYLTPIAVVAALASLTLAALVWQGVSSARQHLDVAQGVLRDYARIAAETYERQLKGSVGYWGLYQPAQHLANRLENLDAYLADTSAESTAARGKRLIDLVFKWEDGQAQVSGMNRPIDNAYARALYESSADALDQPREENAAYHLLVHEGDSGRQIGALYPLPDGGMLGVLLDSTRLAEHFAWIYTNQALLPPSLLSLEAQHDVLAVRLADPDGKLLFDSAVVGDPYVAVAHTIGPDYGGLFEGYRIEASIAPDHAEALIVGGLPYSRLPWIGLLILVSLGLLLALIATAYRDRAVMRLREEFVARVSHELRTPLTQIRMFAETLLMERVDSPEQRRRYLSIINREAIRLGHLVDNVLTFSKRERAPACSSEGFQVRALLDDLGEAFGPLLSSRSQHIDLQCPPNLLLACDSESVRQVLANLIDNAIKYGPDGQAIRVQVSESGDHVRFVVRDEGSGIPASQRGQIWEPYERLRRDEEAARGGAGLGLAVTRDLVDAMGGRCFVEDEDGPGSRFVVEIPKT